MSLQNSQANGRKDRRHRPVKRGSAFAFFVTVAFATRYGSDAAVLFAQESVDIAASFAEYPFPIRL
jgi:hypothetical protein